MATTAPSRITVTARVSRAGRLLPSPAAQDTAFVLLTGAAALYALHDTYSGLGFLTVGLAGLAIGSALAHIANRTRPPLVPPLVVLALLVALAYFLFGGAIALNNLGGSALAPVPSTLSDLSHAAVDGWKDLLTTLPPVNGGTLMALPYLLGLMAGALGTVSARRLSWAPAPLLATGALLAVVILIGVPDPSRVVIDGAVFTALTLAWLVVRAQRGRPHYVTAGGNRLARPISGALMLAGVAALGAVVGPHLPGAHTRSRVVFRSTVVPPFDVSQYPSPLVGFRRFTYGYAQVQPQNGLYGSPLFKVSGLPAGTLLRIAALDTYDGSVWGAGDVAGSAADVANPSAATVTQSEAAPATEVNTYEKVGQNVASTTQGPRVTASVKILNGAFGPWVPLAGSLTQIDFSHPQQTSALNSFRYDLTTRTAVFPQGLAPGDTYRFSAVLPDTAIAPGTQLASGALPGVAGYTQFQSLAEHWAGHGASALAQILNLAGYLKANGHYTDGGLGYQSFAAGESLYRLSEFVSSSGELAGDDEQFAALMALMANELGVPARVVVGAEVPANGVVTGADVHAWVELETATGGWVTLPQTDFMGTVAPKRQVQKAKPAVPASAVPPPAPQAPSASSAQQLTASVHPTVVNSHHHEPSHHRGVVVTAVIGAATYAGIPLGTILLICVTIVAFKLLRRARRRRRGTPARRVTLAWREVLDNARDYGITAPAVATRREQAAALGLDGAGPGAALVDASMFGPEPPSEGAASRCWEHADQLRSQLAAAHGRMRRIRASLNLVTLRPPRTPSR